MPTIRKLFFSFKNAFRGLFFVFEKEQNFRLEMLAAFFVIVAIFLVDLQKFEIVALLFMIFSVLILEMLNTSVERIVNMLKPRLHPYARVIKDITAGAVFLASIGSIIIAVIIFWPYIF